MTPKGRGRSDLLARGLKPAGRARRVKLRRKNRGRLVGQSDLLDGMTAKSRYSSSRRARRPTDESACRRCPPSSAAATAADPLIKVGPSRVTTERIVKPARVNVGYQLAKRAGS